MTNIADQQKAQGLLHPGFILYIYIYFLGCNLHKNTYFEGWMLCKDLEKQPLAPRLAQMMGRTLGKDV